jgi:23S rRNA (uracil-5-)-methyltransferase rumA
MSDNIDKTAALVVNEGQIVELEITDMTDDGKGLGRLSGLAIFVAGAVPGDKVSARITRLKKRYALAETITLLEASAARVQTPCPYYQECGGCSMLELSYEEQLRIKRKNIITKLERIGALEEPTVREVLGAADRIGADRGQAGNTEDAEETWQTEETKGARQIDETEQIEHIEESGIAGDSDSAAFESMFRYRNKAEFAVAMTSTGPLVGFNKRGSNKIVDCTDCLLQKRATMAAANAVREILRDKLLTVYDARHGKGFLRGFTIKVCEGTGEMMLIFTGASKQLPNAEKVIYTISDAIDAVSTDEEPYFLQSVVIEVNKAKDLREPASAYEVVAGSNTITDITDDGMKFEISAPAFYQVNTKQMSKLYAKVREYACLKGGETVFDLYCGIGTIGLSMAADAGMIIGIESVKNAVIDANRNAVINGIVNARYYTGRAEQVMPRLLDKEDKLFVDYIDENAPKIAILDPPRAGCDEALLRAVASCDVDKIVYVSCDPGTLARDIKLLGELGYQFVEATPVDMFVATIHVESVTLLSQIKK